MSKDDYKALQKSRPDLRLDDFYWLLDEGQAFVAAHDANTLIAYRTYEIVGDVQESILESVPF